jgi:hypothetical protein
LRSYYEAEPCELRSAVGQAEAYPTSAEDHGNRF